MGQNIVGVTVYVKWLQSADLRAASTEKLLVKAVENTPSVTTVSVKLKESQML